MQILSSIFSFVDFNEPPLSCNEEVMPIPAVNDFGIKFQFMVKDAPDGAEFWVVPFAGNTPISDGKVQATVICGVLSKLYLHAAIPAIDLLTYLNMYDCYQIAVYDGDPDVDGVLQVLSNPFQVVPESCYLSKMEYWCNENYADFNYTDSTKTNTVWLYMHLRNPVNPTKETRYIESSGRRRLLSSVLDEEYELKTDALTQWVHRKIECALLHDYIKITNSNVGFVDEVLSKNANYTKDWQDDAPGVNIAPAKCRMIKNLSYTNNNCAESDCICTEPPTALDYAFQLYKDEVLSKHAGYLMTGQESEGTLSILPGTFDTLHGSITLNADGSFVYTPDEGYTGDDSFDYSMQNECGTDIGTITINLKEMEPGFIMEWGGLPAAIPDGWLLCDGAAVSRSTYAPLFAAIGVLHGPGNGTTTFNLPNVGKKVVAGYASGDAEYGTVGANGGANEVTLTDQQMAHTHTGKSWKDDGTDGHQISDGGDYYEYDLEVTPIGDPETDRDPIDVRDEFVVLPYIIKT